MHNFLQYEFAAFDSLTFPPSYTIKNMRIENIYIPWIPIADTTNQQKTRKLLHTALYAVRIDYLSMFQLSIYA